VPRSWLSMAYSLSFRSSAQALAGSFLVPEPPTFGLLVGLFPQPLPTPSVLFLPAFVFGIFRIFTPPLPGVSLTLCFPVPCIRYPNNKVKPTIGVSDPLLVRLGVGSGRPAKLDAHPPTFPPLSLTTHPRLGKQTLFNPLAAQDYTSMRNPVKVKCYAYSLRS